MSLDFSLTMVCFFSLTASADVAAHEAHIVTVPCEAGMVLTRIGAHSSPCTPPHPLQHGTPVACHRVNARTYTRTRKHANTHAHARTRTRSHTHTLTHIGLESNDERVGVGTTAHAGFVAFESVLASPRLQAVCGLECGGILASKYKMTVHEGGGGCVPPPNYRRHVLPLKMRCLVSVPVVRVSSLSVFKCVWELVVIDF